MKNSYYIKKKINKRWKYLCYINSAYHYTLKKSEAATYDYSLAKLLHKDIIGSIIEKKK